jgi:glycosidase
LHRIALALGSLAFVAPTLYAEPQVVRTEGKLTVDLDDQAVAGWEIADGDGRPCAAGTGGRVVVPKIASDVDVTVKVKDAGGGVLRTLHVPGRKHPSALPKPSGDVVIYQLPIRTYFATGVGPEATGRLQDVSDTTLQEIRALGADYIWVTGLLAAASSENTDADVVKGDAGSYYAIVDNWDVNPQLGTLDDFGAFLDRAHGAGLRVLVDLVVNHTARVHRTGVACKGSLDFGRGDQTGSFFQPGNNYFYIQGTTFVPPPRGNCQGCDGQFDTDIYAPGIQLEQPARVTGNNVTSAAPRSGDWFETAKLNYGFDFTSAQGRYDPRPKTWDQVLDVAKYWTDKGVDGFRIDVAHAVPVEFWRWFVPQLKAVQANAFLVAEAYEGDAGVGVPGFNFESFFDAGIDTIFNHDLYTHALDQAQQANRQYGVRLAETAALRPYVVRNGYTFTNFMEDHDEVRVGSRYFAPHVNDLGRRAQLGQALSGYLALMPAHFLLQGGQEVAEDASVMGGFNGDNGKTSIFDFVYQSETLKWLKGERPADITAFRARYQALLQLKHTPPFSLPHTVDQPTFTDLHEGNWMAEQSLWVGAYLRHSSAGGAYLVVSNTDAANGHEVTLHFTYAKDQDPFGALAAAGIADGNRRYRFTEVYARPGWVPKDPNLPTDAVPGWVLFQETGVPSGLYLGVVPPATTYVFKIEAEG